MYRHTHIQAHANVHAHTHTLCCMLAARKHKMAFILFHMKHITMIVASTQYMQLKVTH